MTETYRSSGASFDEPYQRMQEDADGTLIPITPDEWNSGEWYDYTSLDHPRGVHVFMRINRVKKETRDA